MLQERGYISRKKSVGTRVESANPSVSYSQSFGTIDDLVRVAATEVCSVQSVREVTLEPRHGAAAGGHDQMVTGLAHFQRRSPLKVFVTVLNASSVNQSPPRT